MLRERMVTLADATRLCAPLLGEVTLDASVEFPPKKVDQATAVAMIDACIEAIESTAVSRTTPRSSSGFAPLPRAEA